MSDDATPTQRLEMATPSRAPAVGPPVSSRLLIALLAVGGMLVIGVVVIIVLLLNRGNPVALAQPSPTATTSPTPTPSTEAPAPDPAPQQQEPTLPQAVFTQFRAGEDHVTCEPNSSVGPPTLEIAWESENAVSAWFWIDTDDAYGALEIPLNGNRTDIFDGLTYPCDRAQTMFTLTLVGEDDSHVSQSWTVVNDGEIQ